MQGQTLAYSVMYSQIFYIRHGHSTDLIHPVSLITACVSGGSAMCGCVETVCGGSAMCECVDPETVCGGMGNVWVHVWRQYVEGWASLECSLH